MKKRRTLSALGSLRFIAAGLIVVHHSVGLFGIPKEFISPFGVMVSFFFILSGFILAYVYPEIPSKQQRHEFWASRIARIWPAHIVTFLSLYCLFEPVNVTLVDWLPIRLSNIFLVQAWVPYRDFYFSYNAVSWAISTEIALYALFPFLIKNFEKTWHYKLIGSLALAGGMSAICNYLDLPDFPESPFTVTMHGLIYINPLSRVFEFVLGMTFCLVYRRLSRLPPSKLSVGTLIEVFTFCLLVLNVVKSDQLIRILFNVFPWIGKAGVFYLEQNGTTSISFCVLILVMSLELGYLSKLLSFPLFVLLGEISYALYLVHQIILRFFFINLPAVEPISNSILLSGFLALALSSSYLLWACIEQPMRHRLKASLTGKWGAALSHASLNKAAEGDRKLGLSSTLSIQAWANPSAVEIAIAFSFAVSAVLLLVWAASVYQP